MSWTFKIFIGVFGFGLAVQSIYTAGFGVWDPVFHRPIILALGFTLAVFVFPLVKLYPTDQRAVRLLFLAIDAVLVAAVISAAYLYIDVGEELENGLFELDVKVYYVAFAAVLSLLELTRRIFGLPLFLIGSACLIYVLFGEYLPSIFHHAGYDVVTAMEDIWFTTTGVFGLPMAILLNLVFIFIIFGTILEGTGAGEVLLRVAFAATGRTRGGPAHAAIIASALFGTMSGSVIANVVGTGTMTIPIIKKRGFAATFAGAVEAAASTGGQIMPPVMGVAAFMMAEFTGVSYLYIIIAAAIPAIFYYASLFIAVSLEARRLGIEPTPVAERIKLNRKDYFYSLTFLAPISAIVTMLIMGRSPAMAGFAATITTVVAAFVLPEFRGDPMRLFRSLIKAGQSCSTILIAVGTLGIIIGAMDLTGLGVRFAQLVGDVAGNGLFLALLLTMAACLFLGMGMPTVPAYIIVVLVLGPAISKLGVPIVVIHMFVFYFGVLSAITPPVALAAYAAAPIAKSNPMFTGITAVRLAVIAFIIPFVFLYNPQLLIISEATGGNFEPAVFAWIVVRLSIALWLFTTALAAVDRFILAKWSRVLRFVLGIGLLLTNPTLQIMALIASITLLCGHHFAAKRKIAQTNSAGSL